MMDKKLKKVDRRYWTIDLALRRILEVIRLREELHRVDDDVPVGVLRANFNVRFSIVADAKQPNGDK